MADHRLRLLRPLQDFLATEAAGGVAVLAAVVAALAWANGPWSESYETFWHTSTAIAVAGHTLSLDLRHLVNDGLMTLFFFVIGLEVKRELIEGELRDPRKAALPIIAAVGGMLVPALFYLALNPPGTEGAHGWAVPMATDVGLALGVLALLSSRTPPGLKVLLLTLAIVDDVGAIIVIALFYSATVDMPSLALALAAVAGAIGARLAGLRWVPGYIPFALVTWLALHEAGVHPTLTGVVFGALASTKPFLEPQYADGEKLADVSNAHAAVETVAIARQSVSIVEWLEHRLHPWTSYFVLPLFALANAGIPLGADAASEALSSPIAWGVIVGLVAGKIVGITAFSALAVRLRIGTLPAGVGWRDVVGLGAVAGVGFTVSIFVAELAFDDPALIPQAKIGILLASTVAAFVAAALLWRKPTAEGIE